MFKISPVVFGRYVCCSNSTWVDSYWEDLRYNRLITNRNFRWLFPVVSVSPLRIWESITGQQLKTPNQSVICVHDIIDGVTQHLPQNLWIMWPTILTRWCVNGSVFCWARSAVPSEMDPGRWFRRKWIFLTAVAYLLKWAEVTPGSGFQLTSVEFCWTTAGLSAEGNVFYAWSWQ